jgi:hypothetical protein
LILLDHRRGEYGHRHTRENQGKKRSIQEGGGIDEQALRIYGGTADRLVEFFRFKHPGCLVNEYIYVETKYLLLGE